MKWTLHITLTFLMIFSTLKVAEARFIEDVVVKGEITGVDGKFVILALKRRLVMVPRTSLLPGYSIRVGATVEARLPLTSIKVTGSKRKRRR